MSSGFFKQNTTMIPKVDIATDYVFISNQSKFTDKIYDEIMKLPYWVADTETTGLDPHVDEVTLLQIGNHKKQYLFDTRDVDINRLRERFEDEKFKKLFHNAFFDYCMLKGSKKITMEGIRCGMIAEQLITCGVQKYGFSMGDCSLKYLNAPVDKEMQTTFINHTGPFTTRQLVYAALDCVYPDFYYREQAKILKSEGLVKAFQIECNAIPAFGDAYFYGMLLDAPAWEKNITDEQALLEVSYNDFKTAIAPHVGTDMFGQPDINPRSPQQVWEVFNRLYPGEMFEEDKKTRKPKAATGAGVLEKVSAKHNDPIEVSSLIKIREHEKKIGTYGYTYINHVHPATGRFHPKLSQIGTETGRPAGKKPNMLNIPAEGRYRTPWIAGPGRKILTNDYGACELRIMASMSGDPVMCKGFNEGLDYHTFTASQFIKDNEPHLREYIPDKHGEPGKGKLGDFILDANGNKQANPAYGQLVSYDKVLKTQRGVAKTINFGLAYGMGAGKLSVTLKIPMDLAKEYIVQFNTTFSVLVEWLRKNQDLALELGYAVTALGRRRYFNKPKMPPVVEIGSCYYRVKTGWDKKKNRAIYEYRNDSGYPTINFDPLNPWDDNLPRNVKHYYARLSGIKREGGNSPIQGGNADITKIAMYEMRKWIRNKEITENQGEYLAHVALQVYDELIVDCPESMAEVMAPVMDDIMKLAGEQVITQVPVETGCLIADSWVKG